MRLKSHNPLAESILEGTARHCQLEGRLEVVGSVEHERLASTHPRRAVLHLSRLEDHPRPVGRLALLPPAELRGHKPEDALDGVSVVLDSELVRNGQQQRVGSLDRGVAGELLDEDVRFRRIRAT